MLPYRLALTRQREYRPVSLETGATPEFAAARALYTRAGFRPCAPFGDYAASPYNTYFTISLKRDAGQPPD